MDETTFREPPRPSRTLAQLRRDAPHAYQLMHGLIERITPAVAMYGLPVDATHAGIEELIDRGFLRLEITGRGHRGVTFSVKVWTGRRYERVRL